MVLFLSVLLFLALPASVVNREGSLRACFVKTQKILADILKQYKQVVLQKYRFSGSPNLLKYHTML